MKTILIAEITKIHKVEKYSNRLSNIVSFDRDKIIKEIEKKYNVVLVKDDAFDFPYFTDGGFYYEFSINDIFYCIAQCHEYKILE